MRDATLDAFGAVHLVCNNAGIGSGSEGQIWEHHVNDWRWSLDVNVMGVVNGINAFVPTLLASGEEGHVVNTTSGNGGFTPLINSAVYATTKAAVTTITECLWGQLARDRRQRRRVVALPVDAHARACSTPASGARARTVPTATTDRAHRRRKAATRSASTSDAWTPPACRSCSRRSPRSPTSASRASATTCSGSTYPSEAQQGKIRARAESQVAMTPPDYLLEAHMMAAKPADRE